MNRKIIFRRGQSPGDILTFTKPLYDVKRAFPEWQIDVQSPCPEIFENNPFTEQLNETDPDVEVYDTNYDKIHESGWRGLHFTDAFRYDIEAKINSNKLKVNKFGYCKIPSTGISPEIYISDAERSWWNQVHCEFLWDGPFWILNAGHKPDNVLKQYHCWQDVVDILNRFFNERVQIVQVGHPDHNHPQLDGVLNLIGKTDLRQLIRLGFWAKELGGGFLGPISFQFVLAAAYESPQVVVAGGKEGVRWQTYNGVRYLNKNGCLPCAISDGCWLGGEKGKCKNLVKSKYVDDIVPLCFEITSAQEVADAVMAYYKGGRLQIPDEPKWWNVEKDEPTTIRPNEVSC